jgi:phenylalanyl-tRNA synthetase beta chain
MGGEGSQVEPATTEILLESATFPAITIRKTASRHNLRTDASARFERGLPTQVAEQGLHRAIELMQDLAGASLIASFDYQPQSPPHLVLNIQTSGVNQLLGLDLEAGEIIGQLSKLGFRAKSLPRGEISIDVPWWRTDVSHSADIAEEVIRLIGYEHLPATLPVWRPREIDFDRRTPLVWRIKNALRSLGLFEIVTYSFISQRQVEESGVGAEHYLKLLNPKSVEQAYLRINLLPSLLATSAHNRHYARNFGMFEISRIYSKKKTGQLPEEQTHLGIMVRREADAYTGVKLALDTLQRELGLNDLALVSADPSKQASVYPNRAAEIHLGGSQIGMITELHPDVVQAHKISGSLGYLEVNLDKLVENATVVQHKPSSKYPSTERDIAIVVKNTILWQEIAEELSGMRERYQFLNEYYGNDLPTGHKSIAVRLIFDAPDHTLTDAEADAAIQKVVAKLHQKFQASLRS